MNGGVWSGIVIESRIEMRDQVLINIKRQERFVIGQAVLVNSDMDTLFTYKIL